VNPARSTWPRATSCSCPRETVTGCVSPAVVIRGSGDRPVPWLSATLGLLSAETADAPGAHEVVTRLADVLLTQALRAALNQLQPPGGAGLLALGDRHIAAAIELIHSRPGHGWTVGELASKVALSRSAFSARFRELAGESPMQYITRTRLATAAELLRSTDAPLARIATQAGYGTEFSFSKAFKRSFGIAPGRYRAHPGPPRVEILTADPPSSATNA